MLVNVRVMSDVCDVTLRPPGGAADVGKTAVQAALMAIKAGWTQAAHTTHMSTHPPTHPPNHTSAIPLYTHHRSAAATSCHPSSLSPVTFWLASGAGGVRIARLGIESDHSQ